MLDASIECLMEHGYANYTVNDVVTRSGLSNGALYRYFPTKNALIAATTELLLERTRDKSRAAFDAVGAEAFTVRAALDALWRVMTHPEYVAVMDTYIAARTDDDLRAAIGEVFEVHVAHNREAASAAFERLGYPAEYAERATELALLSIQGLAMIRDFAPDDGAGERLLSTLADLADSVLAPAADPAA